VVFDYGGVISFFPDSKVMDELASMAGVKRVDFEPLVWSLRGEYDRGTLTAKEYYRKVLSRLDAAPTDAVLEAIIEPDQAGWKRVNPETERLMEDVKRGGLTVAILSNMPGDFLAWARGALPVFSLPHKAVFSCEAASIKPEDAIYRALFSAVGLPPEALVFFDDNEANVTKAKELGMTAYVWEGADKAREALRALGVGV